MQIDEIIKIIVSIIGVGTALIPILNTFKRPIDKGERLLKLLEVRTQYSTADSITSSIDSFIEYEIHSIQKGERATRSPMGIGIGISFVLVATFITLNALNWNSNWKWVAIAVAIVLFILGIAGFSQDSAKLVRDDKGKPI